MGFISAPNTSRLDDSRNRQDEQVLNSPRQLVRHVDVALSCGQRAVLHPARPTNSLRWAKCRVGRVIVPLAQNRIWRPITDIAGTTRARGVTYQADAGVL